MTNNTVKNIKMPDGQVLELQGGTSLPLFSSVIQDHVLTFEESKGYALQGTYVYKDPIAGSRYGYPDFYNECVAQKNAGTETTLTVGETSITTYTNANGHIFYDIADKATIDEIYNNTGYAWYYGVDTTNARIFLPRNKWFAIIGGDDDIPVVGNGNVLGLTNGTTTAGLATKNDFIQATFTHIAGGAVAGSPVNATEGNITGITGQLGVSTDPSLSGLTADLSDALKPDTNKYLYMIVGNTEVTSSITDVTEITTSENDTIPLFTAQYFEFTPNNASWLKAGQQANSGGIYTTAYNTLVNCLTNNIYNLKVVDTVYMTAGVDYSEYWKVDQTNMTFTTPTKISTKALNSSVIGNGMTLGLTNGNKYTGLTAEAVYNYGMRLSSQVNAYGATISDTGTMADDGRFSDNSRIGLTTDPTKSGIIAEESTAQLYFKVANAVENLELLDTGEILEALSNKIGKTECKAYIIETYQNGSSWYRVYSDGWCEQGGISPSVPDLGNSTVNLLKTYTSTDYTIVALQLNGESGHYTNGVRAFEQQQAQFKLNNRSGGNASFYWRTCGYLAEGEY